MPGNQTSQCRPLAGLTVFETCTTPAPAFAAALASDFGAEVVVIEPPQRGTSLRRLGAPSVRATWWASLARNKRSLALDPARSESSEVIARIAAVSGALFRDESPLGARIAGNGDIALLDLLLYATGADRPDLWPWSRRSEFAAATSGMMALTGFADGPAVAPEMPLADYCAGTLGLSAALAELRAARFAGRAPRQVAFALHEALMRMNEWQVGVATATGRAERRNGNRFPMNASIGNIFGTRDGKLLTVSAATPAVATRLLEMVGGESLATDPRFATPEARRGNMDEVLDRVGQWIAERDADEVMELAQSCDVVIGRIMDAQDVRTHPQIVARGNFVEVAGTVIPAPVPRAAGSLPRMPAKAPEVGEQSDAVLASLGFNAAERSELFACGAVWRPSSGQAAA